MHALLLDALYPYTAFVVFYGSDVDELSLFGTMAKTSLFSSKTLDALKEQMLSNEWGGKF